MHTWPCLRVVGAGAGMLHPLPPTRLLDPVALTQHSGFLRLFLEKGILITFNAKAKRCVLGARHERGAFCAACRACVCECVCVRCASVVCECNLKVDSSEWGEA